MIAATRLTHQTLIGLMAALLSLSAWASAGPPQSQAGSDVSTALRLPAGFRIDRSATVENARAMTLGPMSADGRVTLFVGSMQAGKVYALPLHLRTGRVDVLGQHIVASGLKRPVGVAYRNGDLYVSSIATIYRLRGIESQLDNPPKLEVFRGGFPDEAHHGWKFIAFGPDGWLYVPVGAPCNICDPDSNLFANIQRISPDGQKLEVVARGVRNTVGFDWHPSTGELWFTDNGRDLMGDEVPSDELNRLTQPGQHFGYPWCHQGDVPDPEFNQKPCSQFVPPVVKTGPHVAGLGMRFYRGRVFPAEYQGNVFIAQRGSWNRSKKIGYRISRTALKPDGSVRVHETFIDGWLQVDAQGKETVLGRPVDVLELPDGSMLISDDTGHAIYRVTYPPQTQASPR